MEKGEKIIYKQLSYELIGIMYDVYNEVGYGFDEKYYQKAVENALAKNNYKFRPQCPYKLYFNGEAIGRYYIDLIVEEKIVLELKKGDRFSKKYFQQVYNYLKVTNLKLAIIVNFTSKGVKFKRILNIDA